MTSSFKPEVHRDQIVEALRHSMAEGEHGLSAVPNLVKQAIQHEVWRERVVRVTGEVVDLQTFEELIRDSPPKGLGATKRLLEHLCQDDTEALAAINRATVNKRGGQLNNQNAAKDKGPDVSETKDNNVMICVPASRDSGGQNVPPVQGNGKSFALRKLESESNKELENGGPGPVTNLYQRVLDKSDSLTAHAAMIEAGFRDRTFTVSEDVHKAARTLAKHFDPDELYKAMTEARNG